MKMKVKPILIVGLIVVLGLALVIVARAAGPVPEEIAAIREATEQFQHVEVAEAEGYEAFLDCFNNPGVGGMGYHYVNFDIVDLTLDSLQPEALVYEPRPNGKLRLGAVEYIVPADPWHAAGNTEPPMLLGRHLHLNSDLGVYVLHAWIWKQNPSGMFEDWNPRVSCSAS